MDNAHAGKRGKRGTNGKCFDKVTKARPTTHLSKWGDRASSGEAESEDSEARRGGQGVSGPVVAEDGHTFVVGGGDQDSRTHVALQVRHL